MKHLRHAWPDQTAPAARSPAVQLRTLCKINPRAALIPGGEEDAMPWIETKNLSKDWIDRFHKPQQADSPNGSDEKLAQKRNSSVYKIGDLERLETEIMQLWGIAFNFTTHLNYPNSSTVAETLYAQCAHPQMVQALSQTRKQKNNSAPAQL